MNVFLTQPDTEEMFDKWKADMSDYYYNKLLAGAPSKDLSLIDLLQNRMQRAFEVGVQYGANWHREKIIEYFSGELP